MIVDQLLFLGGALMFILGPFLGLYAYYQGVDGPTAFASALIVTCTGIGLLAGFMA
jgi:hypothetical protein